MLPSPSWFPFTVRLRQRPHVAPASQITRSDVSRALSLLQATLESTADALLAAGLDGRIQSCNEQFLELWGISRAELKELDVSSLTQKIQSVLLAGAHGPLNLKGKLHSLKPTFELLEFRDGRRVELFSQPQRARGKLCGRVWSFRDVTASHLAWEEERKARAIAVEAQNKALFLAEASGIFSASLDSRVILAQLAHLSTQRVCDHSITWLLDSASPEQLEKISWANREDGDSSRFTALRRDELKAELHAWAHRALQEGVAPQSAQALQIHPSPTLRALGISDAVAFPLRSRGQALGVWVMLWDSNCRSSQPDRLWDPELARALAGRAALALENAQLYREAQTGLQSRENILAVVSHDLRNPLSTIYLASQIIERSLAGHPQEAKLGSSIRMIRQSAQQMTGLIQSILDEARLEKGKFKLELRTDDLGRCVQQAIQLIRPLAEEHMITLIQELRELPISATFDPDRISQVLSNLLGNAIKFTPEGGTIHVQLSTLSDGSHEIAVKDSGPGIEAALLDKIFDRYWQGDPNDRKGAGLGLSIARAIVEAHRGQIRVESQVGQGACFAFNIPKAVATAQLSTITSA